MHAVLGVQVAERPVARDAERGALDAGFVAGLVVRSLDLVAFALAPARCTCAASISAQSCASTPPAPALMLTSAPARSLRARQHARELHLFDGGLATWPWLGLGRAGLVAGFGREVEQHLGVVERARCFCQPSTASRFCACSRKQACACFWSFQNSAAPRVESISATRACAPVDVKDSLEAGQLSSEGLRCSSRKGSVSTRVFYRDAADGAETMSRRPVSLRRA